MEKAKGAFTNLDKIFWPKEGYTKGDVIEYYGRVADYILPYLKARPMVLNRTPDGIRGFSFFQKNVNPSTLPPFAKTFSLRAKSTGKMVNYVVCDNQETLLYLANLGCIEMHPWNSRRENIHAPDFLAMDLDPGKRNFDDVISVARSVKDIIEAAGGKSVVKTSGKTGIHIYVPLAGKFEFAYVRAVAKEIALKVNRELPELTTLERHPSKRRGRIYLDYLRNGLGQTLAAAYSLRAHPGATVSTPLEWSEVRKGLRPEQFTLKTIFRRLAAKGDLWKSLSKQKNNLQEISKRLGGASSKPK
jgi:bifunctional non-homologous end joining protein LigD